MQEVMGDRACSVWTQESLEQKYSGRAPFLRSGYYNVSFVDSEIDFAARMFLCLLL